MYFHAATRQSFQPQKQSGLMKCPTALPCQVLATGANVVLTTKGIDDMSLKYFVEAGAIAVRRVPKDDLRFAAGQAGLHLCSG